MPDVLVTGGNGQLGTELKGYAWPDGWNVVAVDIDELDLRDITAIAAMVASRPWAAVISGGAYTAVDTAESDLVTAWAVNALAPAAFAAACKPADIPLVHVSTDYVFDGAKPGRWVPDDAPGPLGVYGASKLGGELAVATGCTRYAIVRTSWVVSAHGSNFVKTMLRVGALRDTLMVVDDQHGAPTGARDLAAALATVVLRMVADPDAPTGTFHFSNAGETTWCGFAQAIFAGATLRGGPAPAVTPIVTADYPTPAKRPVNSLLDHSTIRDAYGIEPRDWRLALDDILDDLLGRPQ